VVTQIHAIGNRSLVIILASGMAVGFVLALQMYYALVTYGAAESLGLVVNLSLVRELGPVVTALLFAGRAGTSLTAEIGLMKAGEQIAALELMAIDPRQRVLAPRFIAGIISMPLLAILFSAIGILGAWLVAVGLIGIDAGQLLVDPAERRGRLARRGQRRRQERGVRRHLHRGGAVPGLRDRGHARRRGLCHHAHGGDLLAGRAGHGLHPHGADVLDAMSGGVHTESLKGRQSRHGQKETSRSWSAVRAAGLAALVFVALKAANLGSFSNGDTYTLQARFDNIGGLKVRAPVRSAGVVVGRVTSIALDPKTFQGVVTLDVDRASSSPRTRPPRS
jgi:hypothetical protein